MILRKSNLQDSKPIYNLICNMESKNLPYNKFYYIYSNQLENDNYYCIICEDNEKVIGALNLRFEMQLHHTEYIAEIMEFSVAPEFRNMGIGKLMIQESLKISKEKGCSQIEVACNQLRKDAHRFYQREGMHNFHFKFSKRLIGKDSLENELGK